jgi:CRP/FNR family transcriptional regulator, cyclic AMP receptor protein
LVVVMLEPRRGKTSREYKDKQPIFAQGDVADSVFFLQTGKVKLTVVSKHRKEAVVGILLQGSFFGEGCLAGQPVRIFTASSILQSRAIRLTKAAILALLHEILSFRAASSHTCYRATFAWNQTS